MERAKIILAIAGIAGLLIVPYLLWNLFEFGNLMPISGLVKQRMHFFSVIEPRGGYLSGLMWIYAIRLASEKLLWSLAFSLKAFGLGDPFWMTNLVGLILISFGLCFAYMVGYYVRLRRSSNAKRLGSLVLVTSLLENSIMILVPFWFVYDILGVIFTEPVKQLTKFAITVLGFGVAALAGARMNQTVANHLNFDMRLSRVIVLFFGGMILHALIVVYTVGYGLDYTNWYFANWFVIISLLVGLGVTYLDAALRPVVRAKFRYFIVAWLFVGVLLTGYRSITEVIAQPSTPPMLTNACYRVAQWIDTNLPSDATLASVDAGVIGYFSNRATINLDGLVNNAQLLPYLFGPKTMADYISLSCPDYLVTFVDGEYVEGELPSGDTFGGIDKTILIPIKWMSYKSWSHMSRTQIVFRVLKTNSCLQHRTTTR